jgi:hypothetical protein
MVCERECRPVVASWGWMSDGVSFLRRQLWIADSLLREGGVDDLEKCCEASLIERGS